MTLQNPDQLRTWLDGVDYPAEKADLVKTAESNGAPDEVVSALRAIPPVDYANRSEVASSVDIRGDQTDADEAKQATRHTHSGLAEHERETSVNPVVDELGENRGS